MHGVAMNESMSKKTVMLTIMFDGIGMEHVLVHRIPVVKTINRVGENNYYESGGDH